MTTRVLHVLEALEAGTARHVNDLVSCVRSVEHIVVVPPVRSSGVTDSGFVGSMAAAGATIERLDMRRAAVSIANARAVPALRRCIERHGATVVHGHSSIGGALARLAAPRSVPTIYTPNALHQSSFALAAERVLGRRTAAFVAVSESEAAWVRQRKLVRADRLVVIPSGVGDPPPAPPLDLRHSLRVPQGTRLVGTIARLVPQKAPEVFVEAMAVVARRLSDVHFVLVGEGPLRRRVEHLSARDAALRDRLHLLGHVPSAAGLLPQLDAFVLASRFEGLPYVVLEAMQAGVAVVATDVIGTRDAINDGHDGLLVPPGSPAAMAAAVHDVLCDDDLRERLGAAAQATVGERFTLERMAAAYDDLYARVAATSYREG